MIVRLKKGRDKRDTLTCVRRDGSATWKPIHPALVRHDLAHFVVEKTLDRRHSFFGLVESGLTIPEIDEPKARRTFEMPAEAVETERLVNLVADDAGSEIDSLDRETLTRMRDELDLLMQRWFALPPGESLELRLHDS